MRLLPALLLRTHACIADLLGGMHADDDEGLVLVLALQLGKLRQHVHAVAVLGCCFVLMLWMYVLILSEPVGRTKGMA